jgi:hypothetical protein
MPWRQQAAQQQQQQHHQCRVPTLAGSTLHLQPVAVAAATTVIWQLLC